MSKQIVVWLLTAVAGLFLLAGALTALLGVGHGVATWGEASFPRVLIGALELVGLALLLVPRTAFVAAIALIPLATASTWIGFSIGVLPVGGLLALGSLLIVAVLRWGTRAGAEAAAS